MRIPDYIPDDVSSVERWHMVEDNWREMAEQFLRAANEMSEDQLRHFVIEEASSILETCDQLKRNREVFLLERNIDGTGA